MQTVTNYIYIYIYIYANYLNLLHVAVTKFIFLKWYNFAYFVASGLHFYALDIFMEKDNNEINFLMFIASTMNLQIMKSMKKENIWNAKPFINDEKTYIVDKDNICVVMKNNTVSFANIHNGHNFCVVLLCNAVTWKDESPFC